MIELKHAPLCLEKAYQAISTPAHGGVNLFIGKVRNLNVGRQVTGITYEAFAPLTLKSFEQLILEARQQWGDELKVYIGHRLGYLGLNEISVIIAVSSKHRHETYMASRFIIEELKKRAPIWKQEHYVDGQSDWVPGHALCQDPPQIMA